MTGSDTLPITFTEDQSTGWSEDQFGHRRYFLEGRETTDPDEIRRIDDMLVDDPYGRDCKV